jgi:hypothetical protein
MDQFIYLPEFQIIVCKECKYAVLPIYIDTHFTTKPHNLSKKEWQEIAEEVEKIDRLIDDEETLRQSKFTFPPAMSQPIAALEKAKKNGLQCTACQYVCCTLQGMWIHQWEDHQWKSKQKGGWPKKKASDRNQQVLWRADVQCQRFFIQGHKSGYFEVWKAETTSRTDPEPGIASWADQFKAAKQELETALREAEAEKRRVIKEAEEAWEPNPWLCRVGWTAHLAGLDRTELWEWIEMPDKEEPDLEILCKAFDWMIQDTQYTTVQEVVSQAALFKANHKETSIEPQKPFDSWMDITTIQSYTW